MVLLLLLFLMFSYISNTPFVMFPGFLWSSICIGSRNARSPWNHVQEDPHRSLPIYPARLGRLGRLWPGILHKLSEPQRVEENVHRVWFGSSRGHGNCRENRPAPHKTRRLEQHQCVRLGKAHTLVGSANEQRSRIVEYKGQCRSRLTWFLILLCTQS